MKALSRVTRASDRMATHEELCQVFDLLESIPAVQEMGRCQTVGLPASLAGSATADTAELWLDSSSEEESDEQNLDASVESLVELFAERSGFVN